MSGDITPYTSLVTSEHNQQPNFMAVIGLSMQPLADMIQVTHSIPALYDLDTAIGAQLDTVGQWIGPTRYLDVALANVYFSFDTAGLGFDQGAWAPAGGGSALTALPDDEYRLLLYATVAANHWDGTIPGALKLLNAFWNPLGYTLYIIDGQDMTMAFVLVGQTPNAITTALYAGGLLDLRPAGVLISNHYINNTGGPIFGFDEQDTFISGFDTGLWLPEAAGVPSGYNPPYGGVIVFNFEGTYTPPPGGALIFNFP
jgi:hypothetical protein